MKSKLISNNYLHIANTIVLTKKAGIKPALQIQR